MPPKPVPSMMMTPPMGIFDGLTFFLAPCLSLTEQTNLRRSLNDNGANEINRIEEAEYIFTDSESFEGSKNARDSAVVIRPEWVKRSLMNKSKQPPQFFSASPYAIFSTLVFTCDHLPKGDVDALIAGTISRGGSYREALTKDTTHLLVLAPTGDKYRTARKYQASTGIKIVLVHWFDDCFKVEHRLPEGPYEKPLLDAERQYLDADGNFIDPVTQGPNNQEPTQLSDKAKAFYDTLARAKTPTKSSPFPVALEPSPSKRPLSPTKRPSSPEKMSRFVNNQLSPSKGGTSRHPESSKAGMSREPLSPHINVWKGRRILLSHSLLLSKDRRRTVEREVERAGGVVVPTRDGVPGYGNEDVPPETEEYRDREIQEARLLATLNPPVDVYITKYRSGLAYLTALLRSSHSNPKSKTHKDLQVDDSEDEQILFSTSGKQTVQEPRELSIGSLAWLFFVHHSTAITPPTGQLLHYPVRRGAVPGLAGKQITVSNYTGPARDYLKKLIGIMGAEFTATMSQKTSFVVAGNLGGPKTDRAQSWNIPIVNHFWLEETFVDWKFGNLADPRYNRWISHASYNDVLPGCPVGRAEGGALNRNKEVSMVLQEMDEHGYDNQWIVAAKKGGIEKLLRNIKSEGDSDNDDAVEEHSEDEDTVFMAIRENAEDGPPSSELAYVEDAVISDEEGDVAPIPETSSPHKQAGFTGSKKKGGSNAARASPPSPQKGGRPASVTLMESGDDESDSADTRKRKTAQPVVSKRSNHAVSPKKAGRLATARVRDAPNTVLRSPWEPSPTKKAGPIKPPALDSDSDESDEDDLENMRDTTFTKLTQPKRISSSPPKARSSAKGQGSSSPEKSPTPPTSPSKGTSNKKPGAAKSPKRIIRTQESDEEFQIESQGDLSARRRKILNASEIVDRKAIDVMDIDFDSDAQLVKALQISTKVGPPRGKGKKARKEENDNPQNEKKEKRLSNNAKLAMKKLRDSISGKEGLKASKPPTSRNAKVTSAPEPVEDEQHYEEPESLPAKKRPQPDRKRQTNLSEQSRSRRRARREDSDEEQEQDGNESLKDNRRSPSSEPSSDKPAPPTDNGARAEEAIPSGGKKASKPVKARSSYHRHQISAETHAQISKPVDPPVRSQRGAAVRATDLLHNKIMPDANRYAEQVKKGNIKGEWEETNERRREWEQKRSKRPRASDPDEAADSEEDGRRKRKKSEDETSVIVDKKRTEIAESIPKTGIRFLTTKLPLTDDEISQLRQLGIRKVDDPLICTHLVTNAILRTEKFLCAMSVGPKILEERWIRDCLREGEVIYDVTDYVLHDEEREQKFGMNLKTSLKRARKNGMTLFAGHSFYLTPGIPEVALTTLTNAIKSSGGICHRTVPQARMLEGHESDKHVIGTDQASDKWMPLVRKGIPVYSQEVVLLSILRQELPDWDSAEWKLSGNQR